MPRLHRPHSRSARDASKLETFCRTLTPPPPTRVGPDARSRRGTAHPAALRAVLDQDYGNLEVFVIDGGSTDRTVEIIRAIQADDPRVRILDNPGRWQVTALNIGLRASRGVFVVRVDGHTFLARDYVSRAVDYLRKDGPDRVDNVGGLQRGIGEGADGVAIAAAYRSWFASPCAYRIGTHNQDVDTVFLGAWRREVFERVGPWNEQIHICEDCEHNYRIRRAGGRVLLATDLESTYVCRGTYAEVWKQFREYGKRKFIVLHLHPEALQPRQLVPPAFVLGMGGGAILGLVFPPAWAATMFLAGLYLLLAVAEALRVGGGKWPTVWRIPLVFLAMHVAFGVGFLGDVWERRAKGSEPDPFARSQFSRRSTTSS